MAKNTVVIVVVVVILFLLLDDIKSIVVDRESLTTFVTKRTKAIEALFKMVR